MYDTWPVYRDGSLHRHAILVAVDRDGVLWIVDALLYLGEGGHGDDIKRRDPLLRAELARGVGHNTYGEPARPNDLLYMFPICILAIVFLGLGLAIGLPVEVGEPADPFATPLEILPEWFLLPAFEILRAVPNKLLGISGMVAIRLMNWLGAQGLGNGDRLCEERYWVGDGHNLRRSDGDANLLVSYLDARGTKAPWIAVKPTEPACLGHTSYIGHSRVEPNVRNSVCERGSRPERSLMTSKKVLIEECCRHLGCHMGIGIRNSCREAVLKLDVRQATH